MTDAVHALAELVMASTEHYRPHEDEIRAAQYGSTVVIAIDDNPMPPKSAVCVDVHAFKVGFTEVTADKDGFVAALNAALEQADGEFGRIDKERWKSGPSYIEIGAWIGSQEVALRLIALGAHHELWKVLAPEMLGIDGEPADALFGRGFCYPGPDPAATW
jgi:hypothetical protein